MIQFPKSWIDYELLDAGEEEKLERWGNFILRRPDPQAIWKKDHSKAWNEPDMFYHRSDKGGGYWENITNVPDSWIIRLENIRFLIKPTAFKHTGLFPEQAANWNWLINKIRLANTDVKKLKVLNLFAYTGGATVACVSANAEVCHVDASKGMIQVAKENLTLSNLKDAKVRFIVDDAIKFVEREVRRGNKYDGIIMDPPTYGRGPMGELWEIERDLNPLIDLCKQLLSKDFEFFLVNAYATNFSAISIENILRTSFQIDNQKNKEFNVVSGENFLQIKSRELFLPCGLFARLERIKKN